jgi:hypothetical protein
MKPLFVLAALVLLPGCDAFSVPNINSYFPDMAGLDECTTAPAGRSCLTLHLTGDVDPIDNVQIDAIFELGTDYIGRRTVSTYAGGAVKPPIAVGVILDENAGPDVQIKLLARHGTTPIAVGGNELTGLLPGDHGALDLTLTPAAKTYCFDGIQDQDESDVDCGWIGDCPLCTVNNICTSDRDCANSSCVFMDTDEDPISRCE